MASTQETISKTDPRRRLELNGTFNLRDVGGYPAADGRTTRWGRLFRSESLDNLDEDAQKQLLARGLRTVIDLRHSAELEAKPNVFAGSQDVRYLNIPLLDAPSVKSTSIEDLPELYRTILDARVEQLSAVLLALADADALPAVVHCSAGKDRTGIVVALVLALAGVSSEMIAIDYALTETYFGDELRAVAREQAEKSGIEWERFQALLVCPPEYMMESLAYLDATYGGAAAYVERIGVPAEQAFALREALLE